MERHATLVSFNAGTYLAVVQFGLSPDTVVAGVPTSKSIAAAAMVAGSVLAVMSFDEGNSADAMVVGVY